MQPLAKPTDNKALPGYPHIEKLIETEDFKKVNQSMAQSYETLERMLKNKTGGLKKQKMIRQALKAYDLTVDLLRELIKIKYSLIAKKEAEKKGESKKK